MLHWKTCSKHLDNTSFTLISFAISRLEIQLFLEGIPLLTGARRKRNFLDRSANQHVRTLDLEWRK